MRTDIELLQDLYAAALNSSQPWLHTVFGILRPHLDMGLGTLAFEIDLHAPQVCVTRAEDMPGDPALARLTRALFNEAQASMRELIHKGGPVNLLREVVGAPARDHPLLASAARMAGFYDSFGLRSVDVDGRGILLISFVPEGFSLASRTRQRWNQLIEHLVAVRRLHHTASRTGFGELARCTGQERLSGSRDAPCDEVALSMWKVLASSGWTLVPTAELHLPARTFLAYENAPKLSNPLALTTRERVIAERVSLGHSNKLIAYEFELPEGSVSAHISAIRRKLKVSSRADLVTTVVALESAPAQIIDFGGVRLAVAAEIATASSIDSLLTPAEKEIAHLASQGLTNRVIATRRDRSSRTIANQLATIYRKLQISSRAQLARLLNT